MQIKAVYEDGIFKPKTPLKLKKTQVEVTVIIPDDCLETEKPEASESLRQKIRKILGKYSKQRTASVASQDKELWHEHLVRKYNR